MCLILDQFGGLITCPIQEGDGAQRHKVENYFCRLKHWVCLSLRRGKLELHFSSLPAFAAINDWMQPLKTFESTTMPFSWGGGRGAR
jgi:hypothetical protein